MRSPKAGAAVCALRGGDDVRWRRHGRGGVVRGGARPIQAVGPAPATSRGRCSKPMQRHPSVAYWHITITLPMPV